MPSRRRTDGVHADWRSCVRALGAKVPEGGVCLEGADVADGSAKVEKDHVFSLFTSSRTYFFQAPSGARINCKQPAWPRGLNGWTQRPRWPSGCRLCRLRRTASRGARSWTSARLSDVPRGVCGAEMHPALVSGSAWPIAGVLWQRRTRVLRARAPDHEFWALIATTLVLWGRSVPVVGVPIGVPATDVAPRMLAGRPADASGRMRSHRARARGRCSRFLCARSTRANSPEHPLTQNARAVCETWRVQ